MKNNKKATTKHRQPKKSKRRKNKKKLLDPNAKRTENSAAKCKTEKIFPFLKSADVSLSIRYNCGAFDKTKRQHSIMTNNEHKTIQPNKQNGYQPIIQSHSSRQ